MLGGPPPANYGLVDLYDDGSFAHQYIAFNGTPIPEPEEKA